MGLIALARKSDPRHQVCRLRRNRNVSQNRIFYSFRRDRRITGQDHFLLPAQYYDELKLAVETAPYGQALAQAEAFAVVQGRELLRQSLEGLVQNQVQQIESDEKKRQNVSLRRNSMASRKANATKCTISGSHSRQTNLSGMSSLSDTCSSGRRGLGYH